MTNDASNPRLWRGVELARAKHQLFRRVAEDTWLVPSATYSNRTYVVTVSGPSCACPDFASGAYCKHLWAVHCIRNEITLLDGTRLTPPPITDTELSPTTLGIGSAS